MDIILQWCAFMCPCACTCQRQPASSNSHSSKSCLASAIAWVFAPFGLVPMFSILLFVFLLVDVPLFCIKLCCCLPCWNAFASCRRDDTDDEACPLINLRPMCSHQSAVYVHSMCECNLVAPHRPSVRAFRKSQSDASGWPLNQACCCRVPCCRKCCCCCCTSDMVCVPIEEQDGVQRSTTVTLSASSMRAPSSAAMNRAISSSLSREASQPRIPSPGGTGEGQLVQPAWN